MKTQSYVSLVLVLGTISGAGTFLYSAGWWGLKPAAPAMTAPALLLETSDFYFYAQKQAELYRGELMTYSEMKRFVQQTKERIRLWTTKHPNAPGVSVVLRHLTHLQQTPYSINVNRLTLYSLHHLGLQEKSLQVHMARLQSVADSYQD